jgi:beta-glucosidase
MVSVMADVLNGIHRIGETLYYSSVFLMTFTLSSYAPIPPKGLISMKLCAALLLATSVLVSQPMFAQAPRELTPEDHTKVESLIHSMTLEQKLEYIGGTGFALRAVPGLAIPALEMSDGPYGTRSNSGFPSTTYAVGIGLAASWDRDLAAQVGAGIGRDARARGVHFMLGPGVNIYRSPRNGRNFEYFGEDPFLAGQIAVGYITGMQQQGVSATVKHFLGNNSEFLRHDSESLIDERALREIYLPAFEAAVKRGHVGAIMDSYNLINGAHATQNGRFNIEIARKEWGFHGVMMSDWDATYDAVGAANGGLDVEMPYGKFMNPKNLLPTVKAGTVTEATIDLKLRHVLETAASFGWLDAGHEQKDTSLPVDSAENNQIALLTAREGAVLLRNEGNLLPLDPSKVKTVLLVGPEAYPGVPVGGGSAGVVPFHLVSDLEGLTNELGKTTAVLYSAGLPSLSKLAFATHYSTAPTGGKDGVSLEAFDGLALEGTATTKTVPTIALKGLDFKELIANLDSMLPMLMAAAPKQVSHRFTGYYTASKAGEYVVTLQGSGEGSGYRVALDGKVLFDGWEVVRAAQPTVTLKLGKGPHKVVVEEWQSGVIGGNLLFAITPTGEIVDAQTIALARKADAVIVAAGYQQESETEGADRTFSLPFGEDQLIEAMAAANPKTVVAITSGGNVDSTRWIGKVPAVLESWYGGQEGGTALAEILLGKVNPSGHLPVTFERMAEDNPTFGSYYPDAGTKQVRYTEGIFVGYRGYEAKHTKPLFPFGFGLSYTTFGFSGLKLESAGDQVYATFTVTNTGARVGAEVAQVYVTEEHPTVARPAHELKGFERVTLAAGESKTVRVELDARAFSFWDLATKGWKENAGSYKISVGDSVENLPLSGSISLAGN